MHNGAPEASIPAGDDRLRKNLDGYYQWAKTHNSLLIVTLDIRG
jgi:acid phosphatase